MVQGTQVHESDVLVLGGGAAGCHAAIKAKQFGADRVIQVDKGHAGKSSFATFGAGIITVYFPEEDDYDWLYKTLVEEAAYLLDQERLQQHLAMVWGLVKEMDGFGVEFEKTPDGKLVRHPGRAIIPNVMFHGPQMMDALAKEARKRGVKQINKVMMTELLTKNGQVAGAVGFDIVNGDWHIFKSNTTVLATGSTYYKGRPPGSRINTCDGHVAMYRAGADIANMDCTRHNAFVAHYDVGPGMHMYVGTGGKFLNVKGERFMEKYSPEYLDKSELYTLVPAMAMEVRRGNGPIYLDMTHFTPEEVQRLKRVIPIPMTMHQRLGTCVGDKFVKKIEWMPTYPECGLGGALVDNRFETSLKGLFATGDAVPWAGYGGGAYAIIGAFTSGAKAGECAAKLAREITPVDYSGDQANALKELTFRALERKDGIDPDHVLVALQEAIAPYDVLILREESRMRKALERVEDIRDNLAPYMYAQDPHCLRMALEARNLVISADMTLKSALFRKESRVHRIREDFPYMDNENWVKWVCVKEDNGKMAVFAKDLPFERYPMKPPKEKALEPQWKRAKELDIIDIKEGRVAWA
ncbi:MAG: FAD-dependent oxidoreductase [Dehalococcoidia bacterium]|nr:FAD-dependent oxidoreductase [Dehalococcoidia bacterium]